MPIYEYRCEACGNIIEMLVFSSQSEVKCPSCGSKNLTKLISSSSSFTGSYGSRLPGPNDTACCGFRPGDAPNCSGPGSCCGKA
ncbi:MAG: zinc ribbon domain-containing protein [Deltaproteobacteria bacterium]|nr:zinc ribbon domain-containing protein [Deltaproteobacteria bacterium]MDL1960339.1 zinc ribbon domain-containing protein [Deltaproteobacteria bacterium]